jgi:hypothetical protein
MLYVVEIPIGTEPTALIEELGQMRTWLDHTGYQVVAFRAAIRQLPGSLFERNPGEGLREYILRSIADRLSLAVGPGKSPPRCAAGTVRVTSLK